MGETRLLVGLCYALALAVPLSVKFASIALNDALGAPVPVIGEFNVWYAIPMAIAINIVTIPDPPSDTGRAPQSFSISRPFGNLSPRS